MARTTIAQRLYAELCRITEASDFSAYVDDPIGFAEEVLTTIRADGTRGPMRLTDEQKMVLLALVKGDRVTVRSGRRVGKTHLAAVAALWFWATRLGARVILTAPKFQQIEEVTYRAIRELYNSARKPLGGKLALRATTGLRAEDGRQIIGVTAEHGEAFQGLAGPAMFFIGDEASLIPERIYEAMHGNLAGGGKVLLIGNPTQNSGFFYESHRSSSWHAFHIPSTSSPNIALGRIEFPGLADGPWIEESKKLWGESSAPYRIHVLGEFVEQLEGQLFPPAKIARSNAAWAETSPEGALVVGCDPAGPGVDGDESGFVCRRGLKVTRAHTRRGLTAEGHLVELLGLLGAERGGSWETPRVVLDRDGSVGAKVYGVLLGYLETHPNEFHLIGVRGSEPAKRRPREINHVRDELWFNLVDAFDNGLAVPANARLEGDLAAIRFDRLINGKASVVKKNVIRKELGRSPDLGDALALAALDSPDWIDTPEARGDLPEGGRVGATELPPRRRGGGFDPYGGGGDDSGGFDPYGG